MAYKAGSTLKALAALNTGNSNVGKGIRVPNRKAGQKLKNIVGARPNPTNDGNRGGSSIKRGRRRAALLD